METYIIWLIVMVICLIVEAITLGLTTIWFAVGALVAIVLAFLDVSIILQVAAFLIVALACLIFIYPIVKRKIKR